MKWIKSRAVLAGLIVTAVATFGSVAAAQQRELILSGFGGAYDEAMAESVKSFEKENNVKVTIIPGSGANNIARVRNKEIDVIVSDPVFALRMEAEGSFAPLDAKLIPNLKALHPKAIYSDAVIAANFGAYVIAYNPAEVKPPESWYDLAKPEYKGRIALRGFRPENIELITLFAKLAGGSERNPDAGFAELAKIARNIDVWINAHADHLELYRNDQIAMSMWTDGRIAWARDVEGVKIQGAIPKEGFFPLSSTLSVVAGRPNGELSQKLVNHLLSPESGVRMAEKLGYFPTNRNTVLPPELQAKLMLNPKNIDDLQSADWKYIVTVYDQWQSRWDREVQR
ncbi:ABC transporter substrate-binding protein [Chelatococcus asaccharovorans]|uniref:Putative spermidine/putrescine transport system substrate-binding protein n=1 Tax=Chelatococcus asaccharovorans TaxID=28210 RepID=A0A2V3UDW3_9HYPH|nr:ABC transporter substrate-binding protein [Chelatococcus asaccharovorans]MBS7707321.1 ABC transporter substrate-binding protein [Chelatococcus asaccharovorans]PXW63503.1 putative spermidine/putrescine transport system substrate-binding protein [Chelatococcus asaccharovorans]CAH1650991.1 putative spermidine/putrescine transport system substrate-binding protein [Chelatococcus asaccharovorans]CAH1692668.1 putative spermidine/putrescine transport system substrate-binding protein [Chelatococcus a